MTRPIEMRDRRRFSGSRDSTWSSSRTRDRLGSGATGPTAGRPGTVPGDGKFLGLLRSGFPLRLHYRLELWRVRSSWFDQFVREVTWDAVARNDPLADDFVLIRQGGAVHRYATADELAAALEIPYTVTVRPTATSGRFYFVARLEVTTLNDTDLKELSRWLSGDVGPVVSGEGNFGDALARGAQRVLARLAGLPRERLEARSPTFRIDGR